MAEESLDFMECETCRNKPGTPPLCASCLHNREVVSLLKSRVLSQNESLDIEERVRARIKTLDAYIYELSRCQSQVDDNRLKRALALDLRAELAALLRAE